MGDPLQIPTHHFNILAETCISSFGPLLVWVVCAHFAFPHSAPNMLWILTFPRISIYVTLTVSFHPWVFPLVFLIVFFHGAFRIAPCINFFEKLLSNLSFSPRICFLPHCHISHCLGVLFTAPATGYGAWSLCPLINPIFLPLICNKTMTNFTARTLWGEPAYLPLVSGNKKAINPLGAITTMKREAYCSLFLEAVKLTFMERKLAFG